MGVPRGGGGIVLSPINCSQRSDDNSSRENTKKQTSIVTIIRTCYDAFDQEEH